MLAPLLVLGLVAAACGGDDAESSDTTTAAGTTPSGSTDTTGSTDAAPADLGTIKVGLVCGGMTPIVAQIAINTDAFDAAGLKVDKLCFDGGSEGVQALIGGSVDVFLGSFEHVASTRQQGLDTKAYGVLNNVFPYWMLTATDSKYQTADDLSGEVVGVTSPGSLSETGLKAAVGASGIAFDDLKVIGAGSGATMRSALDADQIAAGMVSEPGISELTGSGDYRILWEPDFPYISIVALASEGWAGDHADAMKAFLGTLSETAAKAKADVPWAVEAMATEGFKVDDAALQKAVEQTLKGVPDGLEVTAADVDATSSLLMDLGRLDEPITMDEGFDFSYIPA